MDPLAALDEPVLDRVERTRDPDLGPVSSATSRRAVSSVVSPGLGVPFGRVHVQPSRSRRRLPTTNHARPDSWRITMPPADVAVTALRRATAPTRRRGARPRAPGAGPLHHDQWTGPATPTMGRSGGLDGAPTGAQPGQRSDVGAVQDGRPHARSTEGNPAGRGPSRRVHGCRLDGRTNRCAARTGARCPAGDAVLHGAQWYPFSRPAQLRDRACCASIGRPPVQGRHALPPARSRAALRPRTDPLLPARAPGARRDARQACQDRRG